MSVTNGNNVNNIIVFNKAIRPKLNEICMPLYDHFNFNSFGYTRVLKDGRRIILESDENWLLKYSSMGFTESFETELSLLDNCSKATQTSFHSIVLTGIPRTTVHKLLYELNLWNSFSLYMKNQDSLDVFHFSTHRTNTEIINLYVNQSELLRRFALYFIEKINAVIDESFPTIKLLNKSDIKRIFKNNYMSKQDIDKFIESTDFKKVYIPSHNVYLTKREAQSYHYLCKGLGIKQIASLLKLSPRTIEQHITGVKAKLNVEFKSQLVEIGMANEITNIVF